jgi:hypothetical protein
VADRDARGRFGKGNPGGPGRPKRSIEQQYLDAAIGVVSITAWKAIIRKAVKQAKQGDFRGREWLGNLMMGRDPILAQKLAAEIREYLDGGESVNGQARASD